MLLTDSASWFGKLLRTRVKLQHPEAPEDTRLIQLFRNRAELKKVLADAQDEAHRLKDRVKLQEAATSRVREQLERLEAFLGQPVTGLHCLVHYQLRELWQVGHSQISKLVQELAKAREERERKQFLADLNRQLFERQQTARAAAARAENAAADVRARLSGVLQSVARSQRWWHYFRRRELARQEQAIRAEVASCDAELQEVRAQLVKIEEEGGAKYPGLSLDARRMLNLTIIAAAQSLVLRLAPATLLPRMVDAMSRSESRMEGGPDTAMSAMQEISRARHAMMQNENTLAADARRLADHLASQVQYRLPGETMPGEQAVNAALRSALKRGEPMNWELLGQDIWSLTDLFYRAEE
ncbi:MAG: hypothetical protein ABW051_11200 [Burkholderiaceae bacterium]